MKKILFVLGIVSAAILLASCGKECKCEVKSSSGGTVVDTKTFKNLSIAKCLMKEDDLEAQYEKFTVNVSCEPVF